LFFAEEYLSLTQGFGNEFNILLSMPEEQIKKELPQRIGEGIIKIRKGEVDIRPGYDGEYGRIKIFSEREKKKQMSLF